MTKQIVISGTDPTNPQCVGDLIAEYRQIEKAAEALTDRARLLNMWSVRDVLLNQGVKLVRAQEEADLLRSRVNRLIGALDESRRNANVAVRSIEVSGANPRASFEWRPTRRSGL